MHIKEALIILIPDAPKKNTDVALLKFINLFQKQNKKSGDI